MIPTYRTDVTLPEDVIEEIVRIYGYDNIPTRTLSLEIPDSVTPDYIIQEQKLRNAATSLGFDEVISLSFVKEKYLDKNIPPLKGNLKVVSIQNPPSPDTRYLRATLLPNIFESVQKIINERGKEENLLEIGKVYFKDGKQSLTLRDKNYTEKRRIGLASWSQATNDFTNIKSLILGIFSKMGIQAPEYLHEILNLPLLDSYLVKHGNKEIGFGGKFDDIYYTEIDLDTLLGQENKYKALLWPKYPPQIEDITLTIPEKTYIGDVVKAIKYVNSQITKVELSDVFESNYTFNIEYQNPDKTLNDREVEELRKKIISTVKAKFGATLKE